MSSFKFNNERKKFIQIAKGWKRPTWAPLKRNFLSTPGYPGARLLGTETEPRPLPVPVGIIVPDETNLEMLKEEIASWLITDQPAELIFDVEPNRTYLAVVDDSFDLDEFVTLGIGTITFICPMPYKLGPTQTVDFQTGALGLTTNVQNKGTVHSNPIIEIDIKKPNTFLDVWFGGVSLSDRDYFRIGMPLKTVEKPVERNQRIVWDEMGRVEIAILDENSKVLSKIAMNDLYWQAEQNFGTMVIGYDNKPGKTGLIYESGDYPNTWNQYFGRLWIARTGNVWEAYISKFLPGTEKDDSERFARWTDENNYHMEKAAQIQISIMQWQDVPPVEAMSVSDLKFWKVNLNTKNTPPYIVDVGDKVVIDTENSHVTIEGKDAINIKDIFSNFPVIHKGMNTLEIMPSDIGTAKVKYRERFR